MKPFRSALLDAIPGLRHGFGTLEEEIPSELSALWNERKPQWKQIHGIGIGRVVGSQTVCGEVDALWTDVAESPIAVVTADCVPVLLARRDGACVAAVHAGWRGTQARILRVLWDQLRSQGEEPSNWVAAIGPAIGPCCYEVSEELARDFAAEFAAFGSGLAVPRTRVLDLPAINAAELKTLGIGEVDLIRACTRCTRDPDDAARFAFHSYRREGGGTRQYSMIVGS